MNGILYCRTLRYFKLKQIIYQIRIRIIKPKWHTYAFRGKSSRFSLEPPISKWSCLKEDGHFSFLNQQSVFKGWDSSYFGPLWRYCLNGMDWLLQEGMTFEKGCWWIDCFVKTLSQNRVGLEPYPLSLRGINWIKFIILHQNEIDKNKRKQWDDALYSQYHLLERKLEFHLLGNHLLENAFSLYMAAIYFQDQRMYRRAIKLLRQELHEQVLPDGAHYEQSVMYHCLLLDRLLDVYNLSTHNIKFKHQEEDIDILRTYAIRMLGYLEGMLYQDQTYPLFNDAAQKMAPCPHDLFEYARRLGLNWHVTPLKESGYRKMFNRNMELFLDVGNIMATYQPGHTHADTFTYELRIKGVPFVVDTGISTYDKTERRLWERGTSAHNTVTIQGENSSGVWSGFRVAHRAKVKLFKDLSHEIQAAHDGFGVLGIHTRSFYLNVGCFHVVDEISTNLEAQNYIHFAPDVRLISYSKEQIITNRAIIQMKGVSGIRVSETQVATEYNRSEPGILLQMNFQKKMEYQIYTYVNYEDFVFDR